MNIESIVVAASLLGFAPCNEPSLDFVPPDAGKALVTSGSNYCVAALQFGEEGIPKYWYRVDCKDAKPYYTPSKWCVRKYDECIGRVGDAMRAMVLQKGYRDVERLNAARQSGPDFLLQKSATIAAGKSHCLALRAVTGASLWSEATKVTYMVDCGAGPTMTLENAEKDAASLEGIKAHMGKLGYVLVDDFAREHRMRALVFQSK